MNSLVSAEFHHWHVTCSSTLCIPAISALGFVVHEDSLFRFHWIRTDMLLLLLVPTGDALLLLGIILGMTVALWALSSLPRLFRLLSIKGAFMLRPLLREFEEMITLAEKRLLQLGEPEVQRRPAEGEWSKKEILGHLVDSASNSHQRFVRLQMSAEMKFPDYDQEQWVRLQSYQTEPWSSLVHFWVDYNWHLLHTLSFIPANRLKQLCFVGSNEPVTLEFLIRSYVNDVQHHLQKIVVQAESEVPWV